MRWQKPYKEGQKRNIKKFLFWPLTIKGITRWLETASYNQVSKKTIYEIWIGGSLIEVKTGEVLSHWKNYKTILTWENVDWTDIVDWTDDVKNDNILGSIK